MSAITITTAGRNLLRDGGSGAQNPKVTYVALGTSSTAPTIGDTQLGGEIFRKAITSYTTGANGEILINGYLAPSELVGITVQEVGFFGGNATKTANSGTLLARGLFAHTHIITESIQLQLDFQFT
jgi:hypothetical protein